MFGFDRKRVCTPPGIDVERRSPLTVRTRRASNGAHHEVRDDYGESESRDSRQRAQMESVTHEPDPRKTTREAAAAETI
jgi:hypothetical protein